MSKSFYIVNKKDFAFCKELEKKWEQVILPGFKKTIQDAVLSVVGGDTDCKSLDEVLGRDECDAIRFPINAFLRKIEPCPVDEYSSGVISRLGYYSRYSDTFFWDKRKIRDWILNSFDALQDFLEKNLDYEIMDEYENVVSFDAFVRACTSKTDQG